MNLLLLRAEVRAIRRASMRITQRSLAIVGLLAVCAIACVALQPAYVKDVATWFADPVVSPRPAGVSLAPFADPIAATGSEASRLLGLVVERSESAKGDGADRATAAAAQPEGPAVARASARASTPDSAHDSVRERQEVVAYLARKYRVNADALTMLVDAAYRTGRELDLDPLLLLSVMGVESGFNPFAESTAGASGLMQLMSKVHADKLADFGGANIALNPVVNLRVGALVLKDCIRRGGSIADGLRLYVGAGAGDDSGYGSRVLQEKDRLAQAIHGAARPHSEPLPAATARAHARQPEIDHSLDTVDPSDPKAVASAGRVAAL